MRNAEADESSAGFLLRVGTGRSGVWHVHPVNTRTTDHRSVKAPPFREVQLSGRFGIWPGALARG